MQETRATPELLWDLVEESLDEAEFLWRRWDLALSSHNLDLRGVAYWIEDRLLGSVEGVRVAGDAAVESLLGPALVGDEPSRSAAAAYILGSARTPLALDVLTAALRSAPPDQQVFLRRGIELVAAPDLLTAIVRKVPDASPDLYAVILEASSFRRRDLGAKLLDLLPSDSPIVQRAVVRAARQTSKEIGEQGAAHGVGNFRDPAARAAAIETGLVLGLSLAWQACLDGAAAAAPGSEPLLQLVGLLGTPRDHEKVFRALDNEKCRKAALFALGFVGTTMAADTCVELLGKGLHSRLAADSLCAITGLELRKERLTVPEPEQDEAVPLAAENLDADVVPSPDTLLPWPDIARVTAWWQKQRSRFHPGTRYLGGIPVNLTTLCQYIERGVMRRRHGIALELAIRTGGALDVETRAFTSEQRQQMATFAASMARGVPRSRLASLFSPV